MSQRKSVQLPLSCIYIMYSYFVRQNIIYNAANSAAKIRNYCRIAKQICKLSHIMRRFCLQNVESILLKTKKGPAQTDRSLSLCECIIYSSTAAWAAARRAILTSAMHHPKTLIEVEQELLHLTIVN